MTPTEMELRVCDAITLDLHNQKKPIKHHPDGRSYIEFDTRSAARAAIRAMREPTPEMMSECENLHGPLTRCEIHPSEMWTAMIDAASPERE
jgi:hypothetical protein